MHARHHRAHLHTCTTVLLIYSIRALCRHPRYREWKREAEVEQQSRTAAHTDHGANFVTRTELHDVDPHAHACGPHRLRERANILFLHLATTTQCFKEEMDIYTDKLIILRI